MNKINKEIIAEVFWLFSLLCLTAERHRFLNYEKQKTATNNSRAMNVCPAGSPVAKKKKNLLKAQHYERFTRPQLKTNSFFEVESKM